MKLIERGTAAKRERVMQDRVRKDRDKGAADDQILFDLNVLRPRRLLPPFEDMVPRNHRSTSTSVFRNSFQSSKV